MSRFEADPDDRIQSRPDDRREWLGGEALVSFHQRGGSHAFRCTRLTLFLAFAAGLLIGSGASTWLFFRYRPARRRS